MKNIGIYEPGGFTPSSAYRSFGVMRHLDDAIITEINRQATVNSLYTVDLFFAARPYEEIDANMIRLAKDIGLPVWVDFDDDIWNIPITNPAYRAYFGKTEHINRCIAQADVVTVSTQHLEEQVRKQVPTVKKVVTINNAVDAPLKRVFPKETDKVTVGWRGTTTHRRDLEVWRPLFHKMHNTGKFDLLFMGDTPSWNITYTYHAFTDLFSFRRFFLQSGVDAILCPLEDCSFNRSKSNIAWLEATAVGAATFASMTTREWNYPGIHHDPDCLLSMKPAAMHKLLDEMVNESIKTINEKFLLKDANIIRQDILNSLI